METNKIHPEITANWARTTASEIMSEKANNQLLDCLTRIKEAVSKNQMSAYANSLDDIVKKELTKRGFKIEFINAGSIDPRDSSYYTISW